MISSVLNNPNQGPFSGTRKVLFSNEIIIVIAEIIRIKTGIHRDYIGAQYHSFTA